MYFPLHQVTITLFREDEYGRIGENGFSAQRSYTGPVISTFRLYGYYSINIIGIFWIWISHLRWFQFIVLKKKLLSMDWVLWCTTNKYVHYVDRLVIARNNFLDMKWLFIENKNSIYIWYTILSFAICDIIFMYIEWRFTLYFSQYS